MSSRTFTIASGTHKGKHIHVTKYIRKATGVHIEIEHNVPTTAGKEIQWVQTVSSNHSFSEICKMPTFVDPLGKGDPNIHKVTVPAIGGTCKADDLLPFYWTADDLARGFGPGLSDQPQEPAPAKGRAWVKFNTGLTEVTGKKVVHLVTIAWGFDRMADGTVLVAVIRTPTANELKDHFHALRMMYPDFTYS